MALAPNLSSHDVWIHMIVVFQLTLLADAVLNHTSVELSQTKITYLSMKCLAYKLQHPLLESDLILQHLILSYTFLCLSV